MTLLDRRTPLRDVRLWRRAAAPPPENEWVRLLRSVGVSMLGVVGPPPSGEVSGVRLVVLMVGGGSGREMGVRADPNGRRGRDGTRVCVPVVDRISGGFVTEGKTEANRLGGSFAGVDSGLPPCAYSQPNADIMLYAVSFR